MATIEFDVEPAKIATARVELSQNCAFCAQSMDRFYIRRLLDPKVTLEHFDTDTGKWFDCQDQTAPTTVL